MDRNAPIGIFDSGVGGLTVLNALQHRLPEESFVYLADLARIPYGTKDQTTVIQYAKQLANYLIHHYTIKALIIACNTASAHALLPLQQAIPHMPVIGVIKPGAMAAVLATHNKHIGVIATEGTVNAHAYQTIIHSMDSTIRVCETACSLFVPLVEEGWIDEEITDLTIRRYLEPMFNQRDKPDTLILGCTHFPLLKPRLQAYITEDITMIDSANTVADHVKTVLTDKQLTAANNRAEPQFLVTDSVERFMLTADRFLTKTIARDAIRHVDVC